MEVHRRLHLGLELVVEDVGSLDVDVGLDPVCGTVVQAVLEGGCINVLLCLLEFSIGHCLALAPLDIEDIGTVVALQGLGPLGVVRTTTGTGTPTEVLVLEDLGVGDILDIGFA